MPTFDPTLDLSCLVGRAIDSVSVHRYDIYLQLGDIQLDLGGAAFYRVTPSGTWRARFSQWPDMRMAELIRERIASYSIPGEWELILRFEKGGALRIVCHNHGFTLTIQRGRECILEV